MKRLIQYAVAALLTIGALYLALRGQDLNMILVELSKANYFWILAGVSMLFVSHYVRAWRWRKLLWKTKQSTSLSGAYRAVLAGYGMNNVIPRSGELIRPMIFAARERIALSAVVATIVVERIADLVGLVVLMVISIGLYRAEFEVSFPGLAGAVAPSLGLMIGGLAAIIAVLWNVERTASAARIASGLLPLRLRSRFELAARQFSEGLHLSLDGTMGPMIFGTIGIWLCYISCLYLSLFAFADPSIRNIGVGGTLLLQTLSAIAFTLPTPGGTGTYHFLISRALSDIFHVRAEVAVAFATLTHIANFGLTLIAGVGIFVAEGLSLASLRMAKTKIETEPALEVG